MVLLRQIFYSRVNVLVLVQVFSLEPGMWSLIIKEKKVVLSLAELFPLKQFLKMLRFNRKFSKHKNKLLENDPKFFLDVSMQSLAKQMERKRDWQCIPRNCLQLNSPLQLCHRRSHDQVDYRELFQYQAPCKEMEMNQTLALYIYIYLSTYN